MCERQGHVKAMSLKGKAAIVVGSLNKLPTVIDTLIKAIRAGELDEQLNQIAETATFT